LAFPETLVTQVDQVHPILRKGSKKRQKVKLRNLQRKSLAVPKSPQAKNRARRKNLPQRNRRRGNFKPKISVASIFSEFTLGRVGSQKNKPQKTTKLYEKHHQSS
jgi:hypothetical protein